MIQADLPTANIFFRDDARKINPATVKALAGSIAEVGLINPIRVRERGDQYEVISGAHRLTAYRQMRLETIACVIVDDDDLHAELAMIDENLCRAELSPAERAVNTARRKELYLLIHPDTAQYVAAGKARQGAASDNLSFAGETASATGRDERTVQRDASRGEAIAHDVLDMVRGTHLDTGVYLDRLKSLSPEVQRTRVERALAEPPQIKPGKRAISDAEAVEDQFQRIVSAWNKAGPEARDRFRAEYLDPPVFDRGAA